MIVANIAVLLFGAAAYAFVRAAEQRNTGAANAAIASVYNELDGGAPRYEQVAFARDAAFDNMRVVGGVLADDDPTDSGAPAVLTDPRLPMRWLGGQRGPRINEALWDELDPERIDKFNQEWYLREKDAYHADLPAYGIGADWRQRALVRPQVMYNLNNGGGFSFDPQPEGDFAEVTW